MLRRLIERQQGYNILVPYLPNDHSRQMTAEKLVSHIWPHTAQSVLDLGCGTGASLDMFRQISVSRGVEIAWRGVDIENSPEVRSRRRFDGTFDTFDGVNLPYSDATFDVVYSDQVFEHVRYPDALMNNVARVLKPGGFLVGSVSYLEPYHSYSIFNFTPYGLCRVVEDAGLKVLALRPCVDSFTLILRQLLLRPMFFRVFLENLSPLNGLFGFVSTLFGLPPRHANYLKLQVCGQFCFVACRPSAENIT